MRTDLTVFKTSVSICVMVFILCACEQTTDEQSSESKSIEGSANPGSQHYLEVVADSGLDFIHNNQMQGDYWPHEIIGPGAGVFDIDGDGDLDLYFRQGTSENKQQFTDQVYLNQWQETQQLKFINGNENYPLKDYGYGMGVTFGDIDQDGDVDIFLSNYGEDVMLENIGGEFVIKSGPWQTNQWSTSAVFVDVNRDGWLDLYVGKYNQYQLGKDIACFNNKTQIDYCSPKSYPMEADSLYLNQQGEFVDVSENSGITSELGYTLGVMVEDFNDDGWPDLLVANDATKNLLWVNQHDGSFKNEGLIRGIAVNGKGEMEASMGIAMTDLGNDLDWDFIMTHLETESNTLYVNNGSGYFMDQSNVSQMVSLSKPYTAFGVGWLDVNNDDLDDLIIINGAVNTIPSQREAQEVFPLRQQQQILLQQQNQKFIELKDESLALINELMVGRSVVFADFDNDGDKDFVVTVNNGRPMLVNNNSPSKHWIGLDLINKHGGQALGASVVAHFDDGTRKIERYHNDGSYLSGNDPRVILKWLGNKQMEKVKISWPNGQQTELSSFKFNQYQQVKQP